MTPPRRTGWTGRPDRRAGRGGRLRRPRALVGRRRRAPLPTTVATCWPRSRRSPRRWRPCAAGAGEDSVDEERREASMRVRLRAAMKEYERVAVVCGAWHVPALTAPAAHRHRRRPDPARPSQGQRRGDLGAVDARPARLVVRDTAPASPRPAGTTTCSPARGRRCHGGWCGPPGCCAGRAADLQRARHRGDPARRGPGHDARPAGAGPDRGDRRRAGGAVRGRPTAVGADPAPAGRRRTARPRAGPYPRCADRP